MTANRELLTRVSRRLGSLVDELVFVGGIVNELYVTVPLTEGPRATRDADAICRAATYSEYARIGEFLRSVGFTQASGEADPPFRWRCGADVLDVMPVREAVLGFTNRWYAPGIRDPMIIELESDLAIRILRPPYHLASKLVAFEDRGRSDPYASADLEDIVGLLANRPELAAELDASEAALIAWVRTSLAEALPSDRRTDLLTAHLPPGLPPDAVGVLAERVRVITGD